MRTHSGGALPQVIGALVVAGLLAWVGVSGGEGPAALGRLPLDPGLIALDAPEGQRLLHESRARAGCLPLLLYFTTQDNTSYCGVASCTMVLNALPLERPLSPEHRPYRLFTQANFFTDDVRRLLRPEDVRRSGMNLETLRAALATYPVQVEAIFAEDGTLDEFRRRAARALGDDRTFLVVNYDRRSIGQQSGGHISPVGAYHRGEDRFLILDVARYKYPPVWVRAEMLWKAMQAVDGDSRRSRGFVIVCPAAGKGRGRD